jgi:hypothetical protein
MVNSTLLTLILSLEVQYVCASTFLLVVLVQYEDTLL